jgi:hypothetical protein
MNWKSRQLSIILTAAFSYSGLVTSFYHHHDFSLDSGFSLCKFVAEVPLADNAAAQQPLKPYFVSLYSFSEVSLSRSTTFSIGLTARAPPASVLSAEHI